MMCTDPTFSTGVILVKARLQAGGGSVFFDCFARVMVFRIVVPEHDHCFHKVVFVKTFRTSLSNPNAEKME